MRVDLFAIAALIGCATQPIAQLPKTGLLCDLDAAKGVHKDAGNLVFRWENQAVPVGHPGRNFDERIYADRPSPQGRPTFKANQVNGLPSLAFRGNPANGVITGDDLINMDGPDVYDHLIQGAGYTWIAVIKPYKQISIITGDDAGKDINILFGNLKNGDNGKCQFCGMWAGVSGSVDRPDFFWAGNRGDDDFFAGAPYENQPYSNNGTGHYRTDGNPHVHARQMTTDKWEVVAARMGSGAGDVWIETFMGKSNAIIAKKPWRVYDKYGPEEDADMMAIGTERDAINHVGLESYDGEFARFLIWERPLNDAELQQALNAIDSVYFRPATALRGGQGKVEANPHRAWHESRSLNGRVRSGPSTR
jgi:hypothetical protein